MRLVLIACILTMCKYGLLKKKSTMKDELAYVDNPIESEVPGHWLPLSIIKKIMEMRAQTRAELTKQTILQLKLLVSKKYTKTSKDFKTKNNKNTYKMAPTNAIKVPTKTVVITSLIPNKESETITTNDFKKLVTPSSTAMTQPSEFSKLITDSGMIKNPTTEPEVMDDSEKNTTESHTESTLPVVTTIESIISNNTIDAKTTSSIVPETVPEFQSLNLTTESTTILSEKSTTEIKTVSTAILTEAPTTETTTEPTNEITKDITMELTKLATEPTNEITKDITTELTKLAESEKVLTTAVTTSKVTETGNPFY